MSDRALRRSAWAAWWFFVAMIAVAVSFSLVDQDAVANTPRASEAGLVIVLLTSFPLTGLLILRHQPRNTIGWLLLGIGFVWGIGGLADNYARYGLLVDPRSLPGPEVAATVASGIWAPALGLTGTFLILLYPDGHLPSPRWRPVAWLSAVTVGALTVVLLLSPGQLEAGPVPSVSNPLALEWARSVLEIALAILLPAFALCILASATGLVWRFRGSRGVERQQLKWLATAGALVASLFVVNIIASILTSASGREPGWLTVLDHAGFLLFALLPISIGIAILRHGLYGIDVIINRALVYGSLTAVLAGAYLGSVLLLQLVLNPVTRQSELAVAGSTLAVAALFRPVRARIQGTVDRRFYRSRYDTARTLATFGRRLRYELDLDAVGADLRAAVHETVLPAHVSLWLRP